MLPLNFILNNKSEAQGFGTYLNSNSSITASTEKRSILVVDDDPDIANLYKLSLEHDGFDVQVFNDPLLALSKYKARAYDLLLVDIKMPQMNGFELYQRIRRVDDHIKVCFISAFEEYYNQYKESFPNLKEADCFIRKPVKLEYLTKTVKSRLQNE
jgi:CheY-like chemotaxis protein